MIREGVEVRFTGLIDAAGIKSQQETRQLRDQMFLWDELHERTRRKRAKKGVTSPEGAVLLFMDMFERALPVRMRLTEAEKYRHELNARRMTRRDLQKTLHAGWRALGRPAKRGALPPLDKRTRQVLKRLGVSGWDVGGL